MARMKFNMVYMSYLKKKKQGFLSDINPEKFLEIQNRVAELQVRVVGLFGSRAGLQLYHIDFWDLFNGRN